MRRKYGFVPTYHAALVCLIFLAAENVEAVPQRVEKMGADLSAHALDVTIQPLHQPLLNLNFDGAYVPLSNGEIIDFSSWMKQKYGLGSWTSDAVRADQETGRTAVTIYGLDRLPAQAIDESEFIAQPALPGCGALSKALLGRDACAAGWQGDVAAHDAARVGTHVMSVQMAGVLNLNRFTALTPADEELGRLQFGPPAAVLSLVP